MTLIAPSGTQSSALFETVEADDDADLLDLTRAVRCATGGDLTVKRMDGAIVTIPGVLDGETIPIVALRIMDTGTTAEGITVFY